jgi:hypothetical protein
MEFVGDNNRLPKADKEVHVMDSQTNDNDIKWRYI